MTLPRISVVTITLNDLPALQKTVQSVLAQDYPDLEYVIVDGGSGHETLQYLGTLDAPAVKWISEPDNGIYDAMNKGARLATGGWVIFLNSGDTFVANDVVSTVFLDLPHDFDLIYGDTIFVSSNSSELIKAKDPDTLWMAMIFNHNSLFAKRALLLEHPFSPQYKIVSDSEFVIWAYTNGKSFFNRNITVNKYERGGYSDINSVMRTVERWKLVSDFKLRPQGELNDYYFQRLLWEPSCRSYLKRNYGLTI